MTAPPPGTPLVNRERVAAAVAALRAADQPITYTTVRRALGGGSDRDIHRQLHELGYSTPTPPAKHRAEVPPAIERRILIAIVALAAVNYPLRQRAICERAHARCEYVTAVWADYLATYGAPSPASSAEDGSDEGAELFVVEDEPQSPDAGSVTEAVSIADGGSVTDSTAVSGSVTVSTSPPALGMLALERSAQGTLNDGVIHSEGFTTQVTSQSNCKAKHTPPACGRRGDPPTSTPASAHVIEGRR